MDIEILPEKKGFYWLNKNQLKDEEPLLSKKVFLSKKDKKENWVQVSIAEGDAIMARWRADQEIKIE